MFVMLPVMLYARKLDAEDPNTVLLIRCAYGKSKKRELQEETKRRATRRDEEKSGIHNIYISISIIYEES